MIRSPIARSSTLASALAIGLALAAGPAAALGLGQIQVKSKPGQPLVAEIPIISSDPAELQGLQVQLASPETFSRVGLDPPQGLVSSLHFEPALDAAGHPVVRVTSDAPVQQPELTFLVEVDWGQGRLVREYSALVDVPRTVAAPLQPPIQAPVVAQPNTIERPVAPPLAAQPPAPATTSQPAVATATPTPIPAPAPAPTTPQPVEQAPAVAGTAADTYGPVRAGQTLGEIAASLPAMQQYSAAQTMLALLRANPEAFIGGNINQLRRGAVLRLPPADELARLDQHQAAALVHDQIVQWREARRPPVQQAAVSNPSATPTARHAATTATKAARTADARLEIVPPSDTRGRKDNQAMRSGIDAGGEGEMLRQQLQDTKETLAARDAEVNELKTRVAELEKLQQQQQQLLTMKDSALAAAQQNLAKAASKPAAPTLATQSQPAQPPAPTPQAPGNALWLWGGLVLLVAALAGWLLSVRRSRAQTPRRSLDTDALIAGMAAASAPRAAAPDPLTSPSAGVTAVQAPIEPATPPWHAASGEAEPAPEAPMPVASQQLEQAQAYLDLGDEDAARALLRDVLNGRDPAARDRAARLLRDL